MKYRGLIAAVALATCAGCASGLNSQQKAELKYFEANGHIVTEKNPGTATALGLLPGGGSFYVGEYGLGVLNLLLWPVSIIWDPISGYEGAQMLNYQATRVHLDRQMNKEMGDLDDRLQIGEIDIKTYTLEKNKITKKYSYNL